MFQVQKRHSPLYYRLHWEDTGKTTLSRSWGKGGGRWREVLVRVGRLWPVYPALSQPSSLPMPRKLCAACCSVKLKVWRAASLPSSYLFKQHQVVGTKAPEASPLRNRQTITKVTHTDLKPDSSWFQSRLCPVGKCLNLSGLQLPHLSTVED